MDLHQPLADLLVEIVNIESVSGNEAKLATMVETSLSSYQHLHVQRIGNIVVAQTQLGRPNRVVIAGHLDTVPVADNLPAKRVMVDGQELIYGRGTCDMKGGVAVMLAAAATLVEPNQDVTWIFYDNEEVDEAKNGLKRISRENPELLRADFAVLMEPTSARVEGGCQGTSRIVLKTTGTAAHSARAWLGHNAIHDLAEVLRILAEYEHREVPVDGLTYIEGLNAVGIEGGVATNVIPDVAEVTINFRFAPDRDKANVMQFFEDKFGAWEYEVTDFAPAARPGLDQPLAQDFLQAVGGEAHPKYGWTDVARFSTLNIPAINFGPANPGKAHASDEFCPAADLDVCYTALMRWLGDEK